MQLLDTNSQEYKDMPINEKVLYWRECIKNKVHTIDMMKEAIQYLREDRQQMAVSSTKMKKVQAEQNQVLQGKLELDNLKKGLGLIK